jgi:hypothetical protein
MIVRSLYRFLVRLYPAAFRLQFEEEMFWIFDQAAGTWGAASLLLDAGISLSRQWLLRSGLWKWAAAGIAGIVPLILAFGSFLPWDRPWGR